MGYKRAFVVDTSEIEGRLDPFYYKQEFLELESKIKKLNPLKLKDYIVKISSGSTPNRKEEDKYYSDKQNGIPFLRVQNLSSTGLLKLDNCKYINEETHNNYLKRSQVHEGDLLVKITGVGRMAVACVAPKNFVGNTNQHLVVIKTKNKETSKLLATYLNTDIGEMLAHRRATGGTRPALDYKALKSIPIIDNDEIITIMEKAHKIKKEKENQAKELLVSIDEYLLDKLDITLPKKEKIVSFEVNSSEVFGSRFDPFYYKKEFLELESQIEKNFGFMKLKKLTLKVTDGSHHSPKNTMELEKNFVTVKDLTHFGDLDLINCYKISKEDFAILAKNGCQPLPNDILFSKDGTIGKVYTVTDNNDFVVLSSLAILRPNRELIYPKYFEYILQSNITILFVERLMSGSALRRIILDGIKNLKIPLPPLAIQNEISSHIQSLREEAKLLKKEAKEVLKSAKDEVEKIILGE